MDKSNQLELLFKSVKGLKKAEPGTFLFEKIKNKIESGNLSQYYSNESNTNVFWLWAICISLIITVNVLIISNKESDALISNSTELTSINYPKFNYSY
jgi:hypothetical protein